MKSVLILSLPDYDQRYQFHKEMGSGVGHHEVLLQRENVMMTGLIRRFKILVYASGVRGIGIARRFGLQVG